MIIKKGRIQIEHNGPLPTLLNWKKVPSIFLNLIFTWMGN